MYFKFLHRAFYMFKAPSVSMSPKNHKLKHTDCRSPMHGVRNDSYNDEDKTVQRTQDIYIYIPDLDVFTTITKTSWWQ